MATPNRLLLNRRQRGLSIVEVMVTMAIFSFVSLVTLQLYLSAQTEFEHSSGTMTLNQRARVTIDKVEQILKTSMPLLNNNAEAFIHPDSSIDMGQEMYEVDFLSTICFQANRNLGSTWQISDNTCVAFVADPTDPRFIYENDLGLTAFVSRQPSVYRYRIAWNNSATAALTAKSRNVPPRALYFERLHFGEGGTGTNQGGKNLGEGPNSLTYNRAPWIADTGTPYTQSHMRARILGRNIHYLTFKRVTGNVVQLRMKMYNRDPETNVPVEGMTMRRSGFGGNADPRDRNKQRLFVVDVTTNVQLPNTL